MQGQFYEVIEINDFPFDQQELKVLVMSKHKDNEINLVADTFNYALITAESQRSFLDQQKWLLFYFKIILFFFFSFNDNLTFKAFI